MGTSLSSKAGLESSPAVTLALIYGLGAGLEVEGKTSKLGLERVVGS